VGFLDRLFGRRRRETEPTDPSSAAYYPVAAGSEGTREDDQRDEPGRDDEGTVDPSSQQIEVDESSSTEVGDAGGDSGGDGGGGGGNGGGGNGGGGGE
jgi:hypothetical protein